MRSLAAALVFGVAVSFVPFVTPTQAGQVHVQHVQKKKRGPHGTIASISGDTVVLTVTNKAGDKKDRKIKTDSNTKFTLDGKEAKLSDLKAGQMAKVIPGENRGDAASEIEVTSAAASDSK